MPLSCCSYLRNYQEVTSEKLRLSDSVKFVKIFKRKQLSRPIPYYHNSTLARRIILSGDIELNPEPQNLKKHPKVKPQKSKSKVQRAKLAIKLYQLTRKDRHVYIVKMKHICRICKYSSSYNIKITNSTNQLYGHVASVILENCHSLLSEINVLCRHSRWKSQRES